MAKEISIGDEVWVHGFVDEIRRDVIIIRNDGGYFGTVAEEIGYCDDYEDLTDTPQTETQAKTQNSNLTFEKQTDEPPMDEYYKDHDEYYDADCPWK